jgi:hypothetical protein
LDGHFPQRPFQFGDEDENTQCARITVLESVTDDRAAVRIVSIQPRGSDGANEVFDVLEDTRCPTGPREDERIPYDDGVDHCIGAVLGPSGTAGTAQECMFSVSYIGPNIVDYKAKLVFSLEALCTGTELYPCNDPAIVELEPTEQSPVTATFIWDELTLIACPTTQGQVVDGECVAS